MAQKKGTTRLMIEVGVADEMAAFVDSLEPKPVTELSVADTIRGMIGGIVAAEEKGIPLCDIFDALRQEFERFEISFETFRRYVNAARKPEPRTSGKRKITAEPAKEAKPRATQNSRPQATSTTSDGRDADRPEPAPARADVQSKGTPAVARAPRGTEPKEPDTRQMGLAFDAKQGASGGQG